MRLFMCRSLELLLAASFLVGLTVLPASAQSADTTPPTLVALSFTPAAVDVTLGPKSVVVTATITDDLSGVNYGYLVFSSPNGQSASAYLGRTSGTPLNGVYQGTMTIPQHSQAGVWKAQFYAYDLVRNQQYLNTSALQALGFPTDLAVTDTTPDTQPPTLLAASFSPSTIDTSSAI